MLCTSPSPPDIPCFLHSYWYNKSYLNKGKGAFKNMNNTADNINTEPSRTWFLPYSCRCNALSGARVLNGHTPDSAYAGIISEKSTRRKILNGKWAAEDSDGTYQREFSFPASWTGRDVYICFDGVNSNFKFYINGELAGSSLANTTTKEFNITPFIKASKNTISVTVDENSASAIYRDVYLLARSPEHIRDIKVTTSLDTFFIDIEATKENGAATVELYDDANQLIVRKDSIIKGSTASFQIKIDNPINWTAEKPYLYTALIHGFGEVIPVRIPLRTSEAKSSAFFVNEAPVNLKAVNIKDTNLDINKHIPLNSVLKELLNLKRNNVNCIKLHCSAMPAFYNLCEEVGFYVFDESESESLSFESDFSPVIIKAHEMTFTKQTYSFTNTCDFTNLEDFAILYTLKTPSQVFAQGTLDINCAPHEKTYASIDFTFPEFSFEEFFIEFTCKLKKDTLWANAGYEVNSCQIKLPVLQTIPETETTTSMPPISVNFSKENEKGIMIVEGEDFTYIFDTEKATFTSLLYNGIEMLEKSPEFSVDNLSSESDCVPEQKLVFCRVLSKGSKYITLLASYSIGTPSKTLANFSVLWAIYGSGEIGVGITADLNSDIAKISRFGFELKMPDENNLLSYYGAVSGKKSIHHDCPIEEVIPFNAQWAVLHNEEGFGIMIKGMPEVKISNMQKALQIDYKPNPNSANILDNQFFYSFTIKPISTECTDLLRESRTLPGIEEM